MAVSRRLFLDVVRGCAQAAAVSPVLSAAGCGSPVVPAPTISAKLDDDPSSPRYGQISLALSTTIGLRDVGAAVTLDLGKLAERDRPFAIPDGGILLVHRGADGDSPEYVALGALCPHAGCPLGYAAKEKLIACPCHGSRFLPVADPADLTRCAGAVEQLPARAPLRAWAVTYDAAAQTLVIDLNASPACGDQTSHPPVVSGKVTLPADKFPALQTPGGSWSGQPQGLSDTLIVVRVSATQVVALSAVCTHLACLVSYAASPTPHLACPCHQSEFDLTGTVTRDPATKPLKKYAAAISGNAIVVTVA